MGKPNYIGQVINDGAEFEHAGVKGMKWGVRKDKGHEGERAKTKVIAKADKKYDKQLTGVSGYVKVNNAVASKINPKLEVINAKPEYQGDLTANPKLHAKYINEYRDALQKSLNEAMDEIGSNASGTQRLHLKMVGEGLDTSYEGYTEVLKHDAFEDGFVIIPEFDAEGRIINQKIGPNTLEHAGIKGMKWGVRKDKEQSSTNTKTIESNSSAERYNKLLDQAKKQGANSFTEEELNFVTRRGNAISQVERLNSQKPGWISDAASQVLKDMAKQTLRKGVTVATKKYIGL